MLRSEAEILSHISNVQSEYSEKQVNYHLNFVNIFGSEINQAKPLYESTIRNIDKKINTTIIMLLHAVCGTN